MLNMNLLYCVYVFKQMLKNILQNSQAYTGYFILKAMISYMNRIIVQFIIQANKYNICTI